MRTCTRCHETKDLAMFAKSKRGPTKTQPHCKACAAKMSAERRAANKDNPEWRAKHNAYTKQAKQKNPQAHAARTAAWNKAHPEYTRANNANYAAAKAERKPAWFGELDKLVLEEAADLCVRREKVTGQKWHVDHDIPLRGRLVSGLHVWNNFRVLPGVENARKNNHFSPGA